MTIVVAIALGTLIGLILGALGGGGAILTVPALVYLLGQTAQEATTSSLVIVGITAIVGTLNHTRSGQVRWKLGIGFGLAGIAAAYGGTVANKQVDQNVLLMAFAAVMIAAAAGMLLRAGGDAHVDDPPGPLTRERSAPGLLPATTLSAAAVATRPIRSDEAATGHLPDRVVVLVAKVVLAGLAVGFLTGFLGVGGGFVIVPALVLALRFPMPAAVGTSLLIIAINSAASLGARATTAHFDWSIIVPFTIAAVLATFAGKRVADKMPATVLTRAFASLLILVAVFVAVENLPDPGF